MVSCIFNLSAVHGLKNKSPWSQGAREALLSVLFIIELFYYRYKFHATVVLSQFIPKRLRN